MASTRLDSRHPRTARWGIAALALAAAASSQATEWRVRPGEAIQAALDAARPGDTVRVTPGTYAEQLHIRVPRLTVIATGAHLVPPNRALPGPCDPQRATGVCVMAADATTLPGILIQGLSIARFPGAGLIAEKTNRLSLTNLDVGNNGYAGVLVRNSTATAIRASASHDNSDSGFWLVSSDTARLSDSRAHGNQGEGVLLLETSNTVAARNWLSDNCSGMSIVNIGISGRAADNRIEDSALIANNRLCLRHPGLNPQFSGIGILVAGATRTEVKHNLVTGHAASGEVDLPSGGVVIVNTTDSGGSQPSEVAIRRNVFGVNRQFDIFSDGSAYSVNAQNNLCDSAQPASLCR